MKALFDLWEKDIMREGFSRRELLLYGVLAPLGLIAACVLAEVIDGL